MTLLDHLRHQFKHDAWANREELRILATLPSPPKTAVGLLNHIVAAQWLWLDRLQLKPPRTAVWPETSLDDCDAQLRELQNAWLAYLGGLSDADLSRPCNYTNSRGEPWTNTVLDILTQLLVHGAHHRGQISLEIRNSGAAPASVDYIHAVRKGYLD